MPDSHDEAFLFNVPSSHVLPLCDASTLLASLAVEAWKFQVQQAPLLAATTDGAAACTSNTIERARITVSSGAGR